MPTSTSRATRRLCLKRAKFRAEIPRLAARLIAGASATPDPAPAIRNHVVATFRKLRNLRVASCNLPFDSAIGGQKNAQNGRVLPYLHGKKAWHDSSKRCALKARLFARYGDTYLFEPALVPCGVPNVMVADAILLADDDENHALLAGKLMKACGILNPFVTVQDGDQVIAYLEGEGIYANRERYPLPLLLLLDLKMARMGGMEVLEWLSRSQPKPAFTTVVLTSYADLKTVNEAYRLGACSFLVKPIEAREFLPVAAELKGIRFGGAANPGTANPGTARA